MASMTDVVFLLLIFFMVTSTYVFPTALEVNLPQSTEQTALKPVIKIYLDAEGNLATVAGDADEPMPMTLQDLPTWLTLAASQAEEQNPAIALFADESVPYGKIVEILNAGSQVNLKIVLATKPTEQAAAMPTASAAPQQAAGANLSTPIPASADND